MPDHIDDYDTTKQNHPLAPILNRLGDLRRRGVQDVYRIIEGSGSSGVSFQELLEAVNIEGQMYPESLVHNLRWLEGKEIDGFAPVVSDGGVRIDPERALNPTNLRRAAAKRIRKSPRISSKDGIRSGYDNENLIWLWSVGWYEHLKDNPGTNPLELLLYPSPTTNVRLSLPRQVFQHRFSGNTHAMPANLDLEALEEFRTFALEGEQNVDNDLVAARWLVLHQLPGFIEEPEYRVALAEHADREGSATGHEGADVDGEAVADV